MSSHIFLIVSCTVDFLIQTTAKKSQNSNSKCGTSSRDGSGAAGYMGENDSNPRCIGNRIPMIRNEKEMKRDSG